MPLAIYTSAAFTNTSGVAVASSASVEIRREDTAALASIFSDVDGLNALANPFNADANGRFSFYAAGLSLGYKITVTKDAVSQVLRNQAIGTAGQIDLPAIGADGSLLTPSSGSAFWLSRPSAGAFVINGKIVRTVNAGALTIALKTLAGTDPSGTDPVFVLMPTLTSSVFDGGYTVRKVTASLSLVISSGSTLGHASNVAGPVYIYLGDNAGTLVLGCSNKFFGGTFVSSSTAEGGAGAADSPTTIYSTAAQTNIAWVCLQRWKSTQTVAGTWASVTGEVQLYPFPYKDRTVQVFATPGVNTYTKPWDMLAAKLTVVAAGGAGGGTPATGASDIAAAPGGGAGGASIKTIAAASLGATETATVGAGGTGVNGASGNAGGSSSFGVHCSATGGSGGTVASANAGTSGVAAGVGSSGDVNAGGGGGISGFGSNGAGGGASGGGGSSIFGSGARGLGQSSGAANTGAAASNFGGGGGGAFALQSQAAQTGGAGGAGIVIVEEFF